jgi:hypothetical protein
VVTVGLLWKGEMEGRTIVSRGDANGQIELTMRGEGKTMKRK